MTGCLVGLDNDEKDTAIEFVEPHIYSEQADINRETKSWKKEGTYTTLHPYQAYQSSTRPNRQDLKDIGSS